MPFQDASRDRRILFASGDVPLRSRADERPLQGPHFSLSRPSPAAREGNASPAYACRIVESAQAIDRAEWESVCPPAKHPLMDVRYLLATETGFGPKTRFWYVTLQDDAGETIGCTCFSRYTVDIALLAPSAVQPITRTLSFICPILWRVPVLLGGSPVSSCSSNLVVTDEVDPRRLARTLHELVQELTRRARVQYISFKEFDPAFTELLMGLTEFGYVRAHSNVTYHLHGEFGTFENYLQTRSKSSRHKIRRTRRRLEQNGIACVTCRGGAGAVERFTPEVYRLYLNVLGRAKQKLERLPIEYFHELARQLPDQMVFTFLYEGTRPVAFCCGLQGSGDEFHLLFCGVDYKRNAETELYFNIIYQGLASGMAPGVKSIQVGAAADVFKQRLGCTGTPLSIFMKGAGWLQAFFVKHLASVIFPEPKALPAIADKADSDDESPDETPHKRAA